MDSAKRKAAGVSVSLDSIFNFREVFNRLEVYQMAKWEIVKRGSSPINWLWWKLMPGTVFTAKWPNGWAVISEMPDGSKTSVESSDPNDHYRPFLEQYVGKQGWDWDWRHRVHDHMFQPDDYLVIKIRKGKDRVASIAAMKWA